MEFTNSKDYWIGRYEEGGNSGAGSYNRLAEFKAEVINDFLVKFNISRVIELGCGDGNQLSYLNIPEYQGFDISTKAIEICRKKFEKDPSKTFLSMDKIGENKADLTLSLDVLYHLIEDEVYSDYMQKLFDISQKYVIIYSCNFDNENKKIPHVRPRKFTTWIEKNRDNFKLKDVVKNKFPADPNNPKMTSFADFYMYEKLS